MSREMKQLSILDWALGSGFLGSGLLGSQAPSQEEEAEAHRTHSPRKGSALEVCYCQRLPHPCRGCIGASSGVCARWSLSLAIRGSGMEEWGPRAAPLEAEDALCA